MKKIFLYTILILCASIFGITKNAKASEFLLTTSTLSDGVVILNNNQSLENPTTYFYFTPTSTGFLSKITIYGEASGNSEVPYYAIVDKCYGSPCSAFTTPIIFTTSTSAETWGLLEGGIYKNQYFGNNFQLEADTEYRIRLIADPHTCTVGCGNVGSGATSTVISIYADTDYTPPTETGSLAFSFPLQGRTYAQSIGYFRASTTYGNNYQSGNNLNLNLVLATSSITVNPFQTPAGAFYSKTVSVNYGAGVLTNIPITKNLYLGTSTHWYAYMILYNSDYTAVVDTASIEFNVSTDVNYMQESDLEKLKFDLDDCSVYEGNFFSSSTIGGISCVVNNFWKNSANTIIDWYYKAVSTAGDIFVSTFPINIFYNINKNFQDAIDNATSSKTIILNEGNDTNLFGGHSVTLITSSTMDTVSQNIGFDYKTIMDYIIYALTGGLMIFTSIKVIGGFRHNQRTNTKT